MLNNLLGEMARAHISKKQIAQTLSISEKTLRNKINGLSPVYLEEALTIQSNFFPCLELNYLFERSN